MKADIGFKNSAAQLINDALLWDNHACMPLRPGDTEYLSQLKRLKSIGVNLVVLNVNCDFMPWHEAFKMLATLRRWIKARQDDYILVHTTADITRAKKDGKLGVCFDLEGGNAVDDLPDLIEPYYALGVRWMLIAYNHNNRLGGGCQDEDAGLTDFGRRVLDAMQSVGMVVDVSHTGYRTAREVFEYVDTPVNFSHSNPRALWDHERNVPDDLIRLCAASGGVFNITGIGLFLGQNDNCTDALVSHINYVANLVGSAHVGLGLDYVFDQNELNQYLRERPDLFPADKGYTQGLKMVEPERLPDIVQKLMSMGWSTNDLRGLLGENNLRVAEQVWR